MTFQSNLYIFNYSLWDLVIHNVLRLSWESIAVAGFAAFFWMLMMLTLPPLSDCAICDFT
jgi:hypothetical protein